MYTIEEYITRYLMEDLDQNDQKTRFFLSVCLSYKIIEPSGMKLQCDSEQYILRNVRIAETNELKMIFCIHPFMRKAKVLSVTNNDMDTIPDILIHGLLEVDCRTL